MAAKAFQRTLGSLVPTRQTRSPHDTERNSRTDTNHVANEPDMGLSLHRGRTGKARVAVAKSTVEKYMVRTSKPTSRTWRNFLKNHAKEIVSIDFIVVPTVQLTMRYVLVFLSVDRRRVVHFNVTAHPPAECNARQVVQAFPWDTAPKYLLRDRDRIYGGHFRCRVKNMGIEEVLIAYRSPWQNPYSERLNGSIRRECLDRLIIFSEGHRRQCHRDSSGRRTASSLRAKSGMSLKTNTGHFSGGTPSRKTLTKEVFPLPSSPVEFLEFTGPK